METIGKARPPAGSEKPLALAAGPLQPEVVHVVEKVAFNVVGVP